MERQEHAGLKIPDRVRQQIVQPASMVLILAGEGLIDLDAPLNAYLPQYDGPGKNRVTIHQMLTHTSGIPDARSDPRPLQEAGPLDLRFGSIPGAGQGNFLEVRARHGLSIQRDRLQPARDHVREGDP
ncbi:MAG: beta-lactamase family protein [Ignavibacteriales bacterium]|nr:beta-lactamase family protein [Ignavibacteriales bacterium]